MMVMNIWLCNLICLQHSPSIDAVHSVIFGLKCTKSAESAIFGLQNFSELMMVYMVLYIGFLNSLGFHFRVFFEVWHMQTVHFCAQAHEFAWRRRSRFTLEFAEDTIIFQRVQGMLRFKVARVEQLQVLPHIGVQIICLDMAAKWVCVGEEESASVAVLWFQIIVVESIHYEFGYF